MKTTWFRKELRVILVTAALCAAAMLTAKTSRGSMLNVHSEEGGQEGVVVQWPDEAKCEPLRLAGQGNSYRGIFENPAGLWGGVAIMAGGVTNHYEHTCYLADMADDASLEYELFVDMKSVLKVDIVKKQKSGILATPATTVSGSEARVVYRGTLKASRTEVEEERILRADAPRMMLSRIIVRFPNAIKCSRLYHQFLVRRPAFFPKEDIEYLMTCEEGGKPIELKDTNFAAYIPENTWPYRTAMFYLISGKGYSGFLSGRRDCLHFYAWRPNPDYPASYKIVVDQRQVGAGETAESWGLGCWGSDKEECLKLIRWAQAIERSEPMPGGNTSTADEAAFAFIKQAFLPEKRKDLFLSKKNDGCK